MILTGLLAYGKYSGNQVLASQERSLAFRVEKVGLYGSESSETRSREAVSRLPDRLARSSGSRLAQIQGEVGCEKGSKSSREACRALIGRLGTFPYSKDERGL